MPLDFTLGKYAELCEAVLGSGYAPVTVAHYMAQPEHYEKVVIFRHDVDRWVGNALRMADLERDLGIASTYYFRSTPEVLKEKPIRQIADWGHEIGYHYETLAACNGDHESAIQLFERDLDRIRRYYEVQTISMHGSPLSLHDSRDLWDKYDYREYDLLGEVYLDIDYTRVAYATDTGRTWGASRRNVRDRPLNGASAVIPRLTRTDDLTALIRSQRQSHLMLLVHPERWAWSAPSFVKSYLVDGLANMVKLSLPLVRKGAGNSS